MPDAKRQSSRVATSFVQVKKKHSLVFPLSERVEEHQFTWMVQNHQNTVTTKEGSKEATATREAASVAHPSSDPVLRKFSSHVTRSFELLGCVCREQNCYGTDWCKSFDCHGNLLRRDGRPSQAKPRTCGAECEWQLAALFISVAGNGSVADNTSQRM